MSNLLLVRQGSKFPPDYVRLFDNPVTLTDRHDTPGVIRALQCNLPGWWSKMEVFAPWNEDLRPCLFADLDTYFLGDVSDLLEPREGLGMLRDFNFPDRPASGLMSVPKETGHIWDEWSKRPEHWMSLYERKGDQAFLRQFCGWFLQDRFEGIVSYKKHAREAPTGRVVCFHGKPKPHEAEGWAGEFYRRHCGA